MHDKNDAGDNLESYQVELIEQAMQVGSLKFGEFTLKSGRISPYFVNAGLLASGPQLAAVSNAYASMLTDASAPFPAFDVVFGPAYKAIPFAACTALTLATTHSLSVGFAYDRKEVKDHGEGGALVGSPVLHKRVVILDDVMTGGTAVRGSIEKVTKAGGTVVGVVQLLDREEVGLDGVGSTVKEIEALLGATGTVRSILRMRDLMRWLEREGRMGDLEKMKAYSEKYGLKEHG